MNRANLLDKSLQTLKREGATGLTRKTGKYLAYQIGRVERRFFPSMFRGSVSVKDDEYNYVRNPIFQFDSHDLEKSVKSTRGKKPAAITTANWFVPYFDHLAFGGIYTIFRFISYLQSQGVKNRIVIYDNPWMSAAEMTSEISKEFPNLAEATIVVYDFATMKINDLPECDIAFCTMWQSAYFLLKFNKTKRKYYFIQDYEPLFYEAGAIYALAESTYRFGFSGIVNTPGLLAALNKRHGLSGISFVPAVDHSLYYPDGTKKRKHRSIRIFFYARPKNPRNAFNLGVQIIQQLIERYDSKIEIITAGAEWDEKKYGLKGKITNKGLIKTIPEVAELYRSCDIGFVYMLTKHPSYQPFEFMASGMATVSNNNEDNVWFLRHEENCLLAEPSPKAMAEQIGRLIDSPDLLAKIQAEGTKTVQNQWEWQMEVIWNDIKNSAN